MADNPQAFPVRSNQPYNHLGMTLRDYFAGQALPITYEITGGLSVEEVTKNAYRIADAMLAARKAKP